jgi:NAD(P)-dependent dehydrogenase (short-subunit alcohol dehydrogenase family)
MKFAASRLGSAMPIIVNGTRMHAAIQSLRHLLKGMRGVPHGREKGSPSTIPTRRVEREDMSFAAYPSLAGKNVLVTGGASGIGAEIVRSFAAQGARVGFVDVDAMRGRQLESELESRGSTVRFHACDLKHAGELKDVAAELEKTLGPMGILVNNAANDDRHDWNDVTPDYFDDRVATNLRHYFFAIQAVAPGMIAAGGGSIINMGSVSAWQNGGDMPVYAASKAAVHGLTRAFASKLGRHRIRVNTVVPGWVMTERQKQLWASPEALRHHLQRQSLPDLIQPVDVARLVLFLASDDAAMCTGNSFVVDGGTA